MMWLQTVDIVMASLGGGVCVWNVVCWGGGGGRE